MLFPGGFALGIEGFDSDVSTWCRSKDIVQGVCKVDPLETLAAAIRCLCSSLRDWEVSGVDSSLHEQKINFYMVQHSSRPSMQPD
jgi:hypothetical protein